MGSQVQIITLRNGMNGVTVNVAPAVLNPKNPLPATIVIDGANNNDVINLASGDDVVVVGSAAETVNGGSGPDSIFVAKATIGATINGGTSGESDLWVSGGGVMAMGPSISHIAEVFLTPAGTTYNFTANAIAGLTVDDLSSGADTIAAGGAGQTLAGGANGKETFVGFGSGVTTYEDTASALNGDTIRNFSPTDVIDVSGLAYNASGSKKTAVSFTPISSTEGTLTVMEGKTIEARVLIFHAAMVGSFTASSDGHGGTKIVDPPLASSSASVSIPARLQPLAFELHSPTHF